MTRYKEFDLLPAKLGLDEALVATDACIHKTLTGGSSPISEITRHLAESRGKGIRMRLLLSSALDDNNEIPREALLGAAAIEIFHLATLVHDDIIDDAALRRGLETAQSKFGKKAAVIGGDYLLCLAMSLMAPVTSELIKRNGSRDKIIPALSDMLMSVCLGEYRQHTNQGNYSIGIYDYLKTISGKTAALFKISAYAGASIGECDERQIKILSRFGNYVGMIFQIMDDCKDYEFTEKDALKPVKHDAAAGIATLPLILAAAKSPDIRKLTAGTCVDALITEVRRAGGTEEAKAIAGRYGKKAEKIIDGIDNEFKKAHLKNILKRSLGVINS